METVSRRMMIILLQTSNDNDIIVLTGARSNYNGTIHKLAKFSDELNTKYNYGPLCFNKAGDKVYFTRNSLNPDKGRYNLEICVASMVKGLWGNSKVLPFVQPGYDFYHPALSSDETRLYFCSNKPGGMVAVIFIMQTWQVNIIWV